MTRLRVGLIGLGGVAVPHLEAYRRCAAVEIVAGAEPHATRRAEIARTYGLTTYATYEEMLDRERVDAACVLTPVDTHRAVVEGLASRRVHVLCEKPIAIRLDDAVAMVDSCDRAGVKLAYGSSYRFLPAVRRARELVAEGAIGEVRLLTESVVGGRGVEHHRPIGFEHYPEGGPGGGGMGLVDHGIHLIDIFGWLTGSEIVSVFGRGNISGAAPEPEQLTMWLDGGAVGQLIYDDATFTADLPSEGITHQPAHTWHAQPGSIRAHGTKGALRIYHYANQLYLTTAAGQHQVPLPSVAAPDHFALQMDSFARSIRHDAEPEVDGRDGIRALRVLLAAYESAERRAVVDLSDTQVSRG